MIREQAQRRAVRSLASTQAVGAVGITIGIATASLLAEEISGSESQAGLAQTAQVLGAAVASWLLARLMAMRGRRIGLLVGYLVGSAGGALCVLAAKVDSMALLLGGAVLLGATSAANSGARYAATDLADDATRARALSVVVWATTIGAVAGPNLTGPSQDLARALRVPELAGPFALGSLAMIAAAVLMWATLRPDPLLLARELADEPASTVRGTSWRTALDAVRDRPEVGAAALGMALAHAAMVAVMIMTPLHMQHGGAELRVIGLVVSLHVLGMYAFSPIMGWAADRFGRAPLLGAGAVVLICSMLFAGLSPEGTSWQIFFGLFMLGVGWSMATVAAATLLTELTPLRARPDVQGAADLLMGVTAAAAGALAGVLVGAGGYGWLNVFAALLALGVAGCAAYAAGARRRHAATS
ncbi:MFS transporter [Nocardioides dubius]|uniref:MFS transporter n=1 Tax=Nocardioides dubius TaxID=317019 RepID=A0ABN1U2I7_9ACTN